MAHKFESPTIERARLRRKKQARRSGPSEYSHRGMREERNMRLADQENNSPSPVRGTITTGYETKGAERDDDLLEPEGLSYDNESIWSDLTDDSGIVTRDTLDTIQGRTIGDLNEGLNKELDEKLEGKNPRQRRKIRKDFWSGLSKGIRTKKRKRKQKSKKKKSKKKGKSKKRKSKKKRKAKKQRKTSYKKRRTRSK